MPVGNTGFTLKQIKEQDFNFPAPLDMTNISVHYDTEWLLNYYETGEIILTHNIQVAKEFPFITVNNLTRN